MRTNKHNNGRCLVCLNNIDTFPPVQTWPVTTQQPVWPSDLLLKHRINTEILQFHKQLLLRRNHHTIRTSPIHSAIFLRNNSQQNIVLGGLKCKKGEERSFNGLQTTPTLIHSYTSKIRIPLNKRATNNGRLLWQRSRLQCQLKHGCPFHYRLLSHE
jgi:hypothetical protein